VSKCATLLAPFKYITSSFIERKKKNDEYEKPDWCETVLGFSFVVGFWCLIVEYRRISHNSLLKGYTMLRVHNPIIRNPVNKKLLTFLGYRFTLTSTIISVGKMTSTASYSLLFRCLLSDGHLYFVIRDDMRVVRQKH
jgi:hypothetical protein